MTSRTDTTDADAAEVVALLNAIPGAFERAELGRSQARDGLTIPIDDL